MFKKNYFLKRITFSFVLLSAIIFSCEKNKVYQDDLNVCIKSFELLNSENEEKNLGSDIKCEIDAENYTISLTVPSSAELRGLKFNITPCEGVSISPGSGEETDFELVEKPSGESTEEASEASSEGSSSKRYKKIFTLTKGEKSQDYTVYITKESAPKLTEFKISANESKGIKGEVTAAITDDTDTATGKILLKIPYNENIDLTSLSFTAITLDNHTLDPVAGTIAEDINGKEFTLTKTDTGSQRVYTVEAVKGPYISSFKFAATSSGVSSTNTGITKEVEATINNEENTIKLIVPSGVTLSNLTPTITVGENTKADFTPSAQIDFSSNIQYTVTSSNPSATDFTKVYTVTVTQNTEPQIQSFTFSDSSNNGKNLGNNIGVEVKHSEGEIIVKVPHNASLDALTPIITPASTLANTQIYKGDTGTADANTSNDFSSSHDGSVKYSAVGPAGGRKVYSVKVYKEPKISTFKFIKSQNADNSGFPDNPTEYSGTVTDNNITITVANTVNIANLKATISGDNFTATNPISITFTSTGDTSPYSATITVANEHLSGFTKTYNVTLTKEAAPVLSSFSIAAKTNQGIAAVVSGEITDPTSSDGTNGKIKLKIPYNVATYSGDISLTGLTPTISVPTRSAYTVSPPSGQEISGDISSEGNNTFTLTKTDTGSKSVYTVIAVKGPFINSFKFEDSQNSGKGIGSSSPITGAIDHENNTIKVTLPATVKKDSEGAENKITLTPTIELGGDGSPTANPARNSPQEFTSGTAVDYAVTGEDGMTKIYQVTVTRTPSIEATIKSFAIDSNSGNITHPGSGTGDRGRIVVPVTSVPASSVIPAITQSEYATVSPSAAQTFASYENLVTYTVTAEDNSITKSYDVYIYDSTKVVVADSLKVKNGSTDINKDSASIDASTRVINITVPTSTDLNSLKLVLEDTSGLSIEPTEAQNFSNGVEVKYTLKDSSSDVKGHYWVKVATS
ncbi:DUF5018 domain-containing protein [Ichthyobacterium seriolicida]|uniref:Pkd domain containing protein n=1 Tax=Ichthyobacterium seriolicida TaxID=242600 RepID=A0A1J1E5W9_9FLAO|nr:hypothetical protein [Ichthyobacterium seriolicida]BAV94718.1 hypothetical protein JBKA6_0705 [Ichthyobacterium seriolicida]